MLLPIGFGSKLRKYPFGIFVIVFTCVIWSVYFFSVVNKINKETESYHDTTQRVQFLTKALIESCHLYFEKNAEAITECNKFEKLNSISRQVASEIKTDHKKNISKFQKTEKEIYSSKNLEPFLQELGSRFEQWPDRFRHSPAFLDLENFEKSQDAKTATLYSENGFLTPQKKSFFRTIQAAFTHSGWEHLLSNLILLILFGIWVEQAVGFAETLLIFIIGSYFGLTLEIYLNHPPAVLGASAGIMALMGAFYVLFFYAELTFYILFWKVHIPCKWIFPCLFFADDLLQIGNRQQNGVAHWAHFGGMLVGFALGWLFRKQMNLSSQELFPDELILLRRLERNQNDKESFFLFSELISFNPRHYTAFQLILNKIKNKQVTLKNITVISKFENNLKFFMSYLMKRRPIEEMLQILSLFPENISLSHCLHETPLSQVLFLADQTAKNEKYPVAQRLYQLALNKNPTREQINRINAALKYINQMQTTL